MEKKKMGISYSMLVVVLFAVVCFLTVYIVVDRKLDENKSGSSINSNVSESVNNSVNADNYVANIKVDPSKDYVFDYINEDYNSWNGSEYEYCNGQDTYVSFDGFNTKKCDNGKMKFNNLVVPYVNINSGSANMVNENLKNLYTEYFNIYRKHEYNYISGNSIIGSQILTYKSFISNDILSIVVIYGSQETDVLYPSYLVYNFDLKTGHLMNNSELYSRLNLNYDNSNNKVKEKITEYVNGLVEKSGVSSIINIDGEEKKLVDLSLNYFEKSLNDNSTMIYVNNGNLEYIVYMFVPGGRGTYYRKVTID